jgi:hypothetical protein
MAEGPSLPTKNISTMLKKSCKKEVSIIGTARNHIFFDMFPTVRFLSISDLILSIAPFPSSASGLIYFAKIRRVV